MENRIRVLHMVDTLGVGGMENGIVNLANNFDYSIFDFMICCLSTKGELSKRIHNRKVKLFELNYAPGLNLESIFQLKTLFKKQEVKILHTHGWGSKSLVSFLGAKLAKVPICINGEHGVIHINSSIQLFIQRILEKKFDGTLSVSESLKEKLVNKLGLRPEKIQVIPKYHQFYIQQF